MKSIKDILKDLFIFFTLIIITLVVIFNNNNFEETMSVILSVDYGYILLGIGVMLFYFAFEALNMKNILRRFGSKLSFFNCLRYSLLGFFFSGITPGAMGGQPMQIYYMRKNKIPVTHSTLMLLIQVCSFHIVTIICGIIGLILNYKLLPNNFIWLFIFGVILKGLVLSIMLICLFSQRLSNIIVNSFIKFLEKIRYRKVDSVRQNIDNSIKEYNQGSRFIKSNNKVFIQSLFFILLQALVYYMIPYFVYRSFGLNEYSMIKIMFIQAMLFVSVSSIPLPGSVGVSETAFWGIYLTIFGKNVLASATLLNRGINFYFFILIGFVVTLYTIIKTKKAHI